MEGVSAIGTTLEALADQTRLDLDAKYVHGLALATLASEEETLGD